MNKGIMIGILMIALIFGELRCFYKMVKCNWDPIGKAEIVYTAAAFTGLGCIVGYFNIKDN
jgi:hypothetical protein